MEVVFMKIPAWVGAIAYRQVGEDCLVLLQYSRSINPRFKRQDGQWKFPGGGPEDGDGDSLGTLSREFPAETYLRVKDGVDIGRPIYDQIQRSVQYIVYAIEWDSLVGNIRTEDIVDGDSLLGELKWFTLAEAERVIYGTHLPALRRFTRDYRPRQAS